MNFNSEKPEENSAYVQLLILCGYVLLGTIAGAILGIGAMVGLYGMESLQNLTMAGGTDLSYLTGLRIAQTLTTLFMFLLPPLLLAATERIKTTEFYGLKVPSLQLLFLVFLIMMCALPVMEWVALANQKMVFPDFLKPVEEWMRRKEDEAMKMTVLLLTMRQVWDFIINILMIAMLPAIAEELLFRGGVQRSFLRMFGNPHVAIWLSAFIFSAIHMQFYGFFPRMFLGAAFGYMYLWTGSLWCSMFAHFLNNGYAVCVAWYLQLHHMPLSEADNSSNFKWYGYIISLILTTILFLYLKQRTNGKQLD
ncbi:lysostaphin resistance A-like protein [Pedobacter sp. AW31-3R]|uniref:CPBP family intramembrane glutamic endopeptidase n=1 Tax=Pedobacter sp. AW31-3R TaxID=3445781 RepID=UPI003F9F3504